MRSIKKDKYGINENAAKLFMVRFAIFYLSWAHQLAQMMSLVPISVLQLSQDEAQL